MVEEGGDALTADWSFAEPSSGSGAVAMLVSDRPHVFQVDVGANGYYGYEVMDTCRPSTDGDAGDTDLSLLSYLDCCENAFLEYQQPRAGRRLLHYLRLPGLSHAIRRHGQGRAPQHDAQAGQGRDRARSRPTSSAA